VAGCAWWPGSCRAVSPACWSRRESRPPTLRLRHSATYTNKIFRSRYTLILFSFLGAHFRIHIPLNSDPDLASFAEYGSASRLFFRLQIEVLNMANNGPKLCELGRSCQNAQLLYVFPGFLIESPQTSRDSEQIFKTRIFGQCFGSVLDTDSIRSVDPNPESESGYGSRRAKSTHQNSKKLRI
jgi:hypothetical protein